MKKIFNLIIACFFIFSMQAQVYKTTDNKVVTDNGRPLANSTSYTSVICSGTKVLTSQSTGKVYVKSKLLAATQTLISRFTVPPTYAQKVCLDTLEMMCRDSGINTNYDVFYCFNLSTAQQAYQNIIQNKWNAVVTSSPDMTIKHGYHMGAVVGYNNYLKIANYDSAQWVKFSQTNGSFVFWVDSIGNTASYWFGMINTTPYSSGYLQMYNTNDIQWITTDVVYTSHRMHQDTTFTFTRASGTLTEYINTTPYQLATGQTNGYALRKATVAGAGFGIWGTINTANQTGTRGSICTIKYILIGKGTLTTTDVRKTVNVLKWFNTRAKVVF